MTNLKSCSLSIITFALLAASPVWAGPIDVLRTDPKFGASSAVVYYFDSWDPAVLFFPLPFGASVDSYTGNREDLRGFVRLSLFAIFDASAPETGPLDGNFLIEDANGAFLAGTLQAVGFVEDTIELLFGSLSGAGASAFGANVLAEIDFLLPLDPNPFGESYLVSVTISNVPAPSALALLATALLGMSLFRRKRSTSICRHVQRLAGHANPATAQRYDRRPMDTDRLATEVLHLPYKRG